jgi:hypothetical protein
MSERLSASMWPLKEWAQTTDLAKFGDLVVVEHPDFRPKPLWNH